MISIEVEIDPALKGPNKSAVVSIIKQVLESEGFQDGSISFILGSDELLSNLKKEYFNKDQWTDVIAFRLNDYDEEEVEGEIYISLPRAKENAKKFEESVNKELGRLIIHGGLHLLGYEDESENEKAAMTQKENNYLNQVNWDQLYG
ncbi:MAG: rRNA maturation RNase YbeY [Candidatus Marinimicrobia bacterium]|nr:rRNA maturation RNase YbeY [Candidatus Neomarinimicrobiota bacterium]MBL7011099.1 rRNA maturation RNase YbeY [Candidatus Neomarinimicrobiota bacterium]MBL7030816.1 rRNA maturation RNase YbeY [Candidatus Neomarinimicrobiota bacterium]